MGKTAKAASASYKQRLAAMEAEGDETSPKKKLMSAKGSSSMGPDRDVTATPRKRKCEPGPNANKMSSSAKAGNKKVFRSTQLREISASQLII